MRALLIGVAAIVVLLVVAVFAIPALVPTGALVARLEQTVAERTGHKLAIAGPVKVSVIPKLAVTADQVSLSGFAGGTDLVKLGRLELRLALLPLLSGEARIEKFVLQQPQVALEVDKQGRQNWTMTPAQPPAAAPSQGGATVREVALGDVEVVNGSLVYSDARSGTIHKVEAANLALTLPSLDKPLGIDADFKLDGRPVELDGTLAQPRVLLDGGATPLKVALKGPDTQASLEGELRFAPGQPVQVAGTLGASAADLAGTAEWLTGTRPASLPVKTVKLAGKLDASPSRIGLKDMTLNADDLVGTGAAAIGLGGARPDIKAQLKLGKLELDRFLPPPAKAAPAPAAQAPAPAGAAPTPAPAAGWSREPIDLSGLRAADADLQLAIDGATARGVEIGATTLTAVVKDGRLQARLADTAMFGGKLGGSVVADGQGQVPAVQLAVKADGVQAEPLLTRFMDFTRLSGTMAGDVSLQGSGRSQHDLVQTLGGNGRLMFRDGAVKGINIAKLVRSVTGGSTEGPQQTDFAELGGSFQMQNGVARTEDLRMVAPVVRLEGKGQVMLPPRQVDMRLTPRLVASIEGQGASRTDQKGLSVPILVRGTFDNLSFTPDVRGVAEEALKNPEAIGKTVEQLKGTKPKDAVRGLLQGLTGGSAPAPAGTP